MPRRGRRRGRKRSGRKRKKDEVDEEEGEAGETVVHVQCPRCKRLFEREDNDPFCPYCEYDTSKTPSGPIHQRPEEHDLKYVLLYIVLGLTIFTGILFIYYLIIPDPEADPASSNLSIGLILFPFAACLSVLVILLFLIIKRKRIREGLKSRLILSALLGVFISCLIVGVGKIGGFFTQESNRNEWLSDTETVHNLFIIVALFSLILLGGYFFYLNYQKKMEAQ